ncbi:MAG TPA: hypothetical protein VE010_06415, partial [Thermoanaerobaculia bacterium]|nr:hypothetical protein [Thermoanaerobaculia bacterium]
GVVAGSFAPVQKVRAYAYEAPTNTQRFLLRAIGLDVDEEPGLYTNGGSGDSFGVFGRYTISPSMNIVAEAARASFTSLGALEPERKGNALRLGVNGMRGRIGYQLNLRRTDAGYLNPADRGFTPGSVSDRQGGDLSLTAMFGRTSLSVTARHLTSGGSSDSLSPDASENGLTATLSSMLGQILTVSAVVNFTADETDADVTTGLPAVDRRMSGGQLTFGQALGRLTLSQSLQYNRTDSRVGPYGDAVIRGATVTASGTLSSFANLSAFVSAIRSETTPEAGVTDQLMLTLQPSIVIAPYSVSLLPVLTYSRMTNDVFGDTETQSFTPMLMWTPPWLRQSLALQVSGGWQRTETAGQPASEPDPTYAASLSLRWPMRAGATAPAAPILPGATPIAPPEQGSANPVQSSATTTQQN